MAQPHIQVILADETIPDSLHSALQRTAATAAFWPLSEAVRPGRTPPADVVVVVVPDDPTELAGPLRRLFDRLAESPRATIVLRASGAALPSLSFPPTLPVTFFSGHNDHELSGRLNAMLAMRPCLESLQRDAVAHRRNGETIAKRYANQLRLASQVQREFLPEELPRFGAASFDLVFRPVDYVSGDIYDVHRLDETHVGIALADATGHGIPAALLTVYIKRALRGKEIENGSYRILSPDEVLARLNDDILDARLTECPFVAAVYAVLNIETYELTLARGGAPFPIHRSGAGELCILASQGTIVGVAPGMRCEVRTLQLRPGDSVLFYSDGLERIVAPESAARDVPPQVRRAARQLARARRAAYRVRSVTEEPDSAATALLEPPGPAAASPVANSSWLGTIQTEGPTAALAQIAGRQRALRRMGYPLDDLTVLCLNIDA